MNIAYIRISTENQSEKRQYESLSEKNIEKYFVEYVSGKNMVDRPVLNTMLDFVREGDTVFVHDFSRLARCTKDLLDITDKLQEKGVNFISIKENIDTSTPMGKLMLTMLGAIYEFERENMLERQREGIAIAKKEGRYRGGQPKKYDKVLFEKMYKQYKCRVISKVEFAKIMKVSRPTLDRLIKENFPETK